MQREEASPEPDDNEDFHVVARGRDARGGRASEGGNTGCKVGYISSSRFELIVGVDIPTDHVDGLNLFVPQGRHLLRVCFLALTQLEVLRRQHEGDHHGVRGNRFGSKIRT